MSISWFLYSDDVVTGPFSTEDVNVKLQSGVVSPHSFIWWKGQREWIQITVWSQQLPTILRAIDFSSQLNPVWYIEMAGSRLGPITQTELVSHLKSLRDLTKVKLWAVGMPAWANIFELHDVMDLIGISRRENERAPLMGNVTITRTSDAPRTYTLRSASISAGGVGMVGSNDLRPGDEIELVINSAHLGAVLHARGKVLYINSKNFVGVQFSHPQAEMVSVISDYVKKFMQPLG
ncbi:MAG: hypothetical protein EOP09_14305, partial [Proteobacteria bacterium]